MSPKPIQPFGTDTAFHVCPPFTVRRIPALTLDPTQTVADVQVSESGSVPGSGEATQVAPPSLETNATGAGGGPGGL